MSTYNKRSHEFVWSTVDAVASASRFAGRTAEIVGHVASFAMWRSSAGLTDGRRCMTRRTLWNETIFPRLQSGPVTVLEFGVASGDTTRYWLENVPNPELRWHGFDVFTGLPEAWSRGGIEFAPAGAFDAGGKPPVLDDERASFHVGLVQETLPELDLGSGPLCVIFDLDLYAPSAFALAHLSSRLQAGDLLYFDEAYDPWHERRALDEFMVDHEVRSLGFTGVGLVTEYVAPLNGGRIRSEDSATA